MNRPSLGSAESKTHREAARRIFRIENHDEALPIWRDSGGANRILVHVDAHHDMWWVPPGELVTIANFIAPALRDGLLREIYWVVPDRSWESLDNRRQILHHLRRIQQNCPVRPERLEIARDHISTTLFGKPLHICSVEGLPEFREDVLLDLDVDYLIFPRVTYGRGDPHPALPWCWPEDLISGLHRRGLRSDIVTIAYSVQGGYTPLFWKYLGDELEARLNGSAPEALRGMERMREGAEAAARLEYDSADRKYQDAEERLPNLAAPLWHRAFLYLDSGRVNQGREIYQRALDLDPSYRAVYNSVALWHYWGRRWGAAEREYRRTLALDPRDAYAHLGLGWIAMERSDWSEAESELRKAIESHPDLLDAHRAQGRVFGKLGRRREAITAYEKSLKLALLGHEPLRESHSISAERQPLNDRSHFAVYLRLGQLHYAEGDLARTCQYLRMAAAGSLDSAGIRCRLASIAFRQRQWNTAWMEAGQALKQSAVWGRRWAKKFLRGVQRPFKRAYEFWQVR